MLIVGASNALAAYALYAGKVPSTSLAMLVYMAVVSLDKDAEPWWSQGHAMLAVQCLGRDELTPTGDDQADQKALEAMRRAVERANIRRLQLDDLSVARSQAREARAVVRDDGEFDLVEVRLAGLPVVRVAAQEQVIPPLPRCHHERTGTDGMAEELRRALPAEVAWHDPVDEQR